MDKTRGTHITTILYDLDGVLIETKKWHFNTLNTALKKYGYTISEDEHKNIYEGLPTLNKLKIMTTRIGLNPSLYDNIIRDKNNEITKYIDTCNVDQSKLELVIKMKKAGIKQAVCSNTTKQTVVLVLQRMNLINYLDVIFTKQDIDIPKPHPMIYLKAINHFNEIPSNCLILEDSNHGLKAAIESGAQILKVENTKDVNYEKVYKEMLRYA